MCNCVTPTEEKIVSKAIYKVIAVEKAAAASDTASRLLLLGAGNSGKSTITKQILIGYRNGFTPEEIEAYKVSIRNNLFSGIAQIVQRRIFVGILPPTPDDVRKVSYMEGSGASDPEWEQDLLRLWNDPLNQQAYPQKSKLGIEIRVE